MLLIDISQTATYLECLVSTHRLAITLILLTDHQHTDDSILESNPVVLVNKVSGVDEKEVVEESHDGNKEKKESVVIVVEVPGTHQGTVQSDN